MGSDVSRRAARKAYSVASESAGNYDPADLVSGVLVGYLDRS
jgi:hypothetical protein